MYRLPENLKSKYEFVTLSAKRAEQLQAGALPRCDHDENSKVTVIAQAEVAKGVVREFDPETEALEDTSEQE